MLCFAACGSEETSRLRAQPELAPEPEDSLPEDALPVVPQSTATACGHLSAGLRAHGARNGHDIKVEEPPSACAIARPCETESEAATMPTGGDSADETVPELRQLRHTLRQLESECGGTSLFFITCTPLLTCARKGQGIERRGKSRIVND